MAVPLLPLNVLFVNAALSIVPLVGRGMGVVATRVICAGELLVIERAAASVSPYENVPEGVNGTALRLAERLAEAIESDADLSSRVGALEGYAEAYNASLCAYPGNEDVAAFRGASAVCAHNAFAIKGEGEGDDDEGETRTGEGLWAYCARFNHSCAPSARWFIADANVLHVRAAAAIRVGEEITISYGPGEEVMFCERERARLMQATWGFQCDASCRLCVGQRRINEDAASASKKHPLQWAAAPGPMPEPFRVRLRRGSVSAHLTLAEKVAQARAALENVKNTDENVALYHAASLLYTGAAFFEGKNRNNENARSLWKQVIACCVACPALLGEEAARAAENLARTEVEVGVGVGAEWRAAALRLRGGCETPD